MNGIYAILDENNFNFEHLDRYVVLMIQNKIKIFQIRIKSPFSNFYIDTIKKIRDICKYNNCKIILNDNINISKELNLDGVHLGKNDCDIISARHILGEKKIIGVSCYNSIDLALYAEKNKASYVSFGSLNKTTTKSNTINLDKDIFSEAKKFLNTTTCLIGGININNIRDAMKLNSNLIAISKGLSSYDQIKKISKAYYG